MGELVVRQVGSWTIFAGVSRAELTSQTSQLQLSDLHWFERRHYSFDCNWKVFVDNYLDGGYHVPYLHKGLDSVLDYSNYMIENGEHYCLQWSPIVSEGAEQQTGAVRKATGRSITGSIQTS
jgi:choline monooxygenase